MTDQPEGQPAARPLVSVVCPVYNEVDAIASFHSSLMDVIAAFSEPCEIVYVDDGSVDGSAAVLHSFATSSRVRVVELSRNFGKEAALSAGIHHAHGEIVVTIDTDGEHPVALIPQLVQPVLDGSADVVAGVRTSRDRAPIVKRVGSRAFYGVLRRFGSDTHLEQNSTDFRAFSREVADNFSSLGERGRIVRSLIDWTGFRSVEFEFAAEPRIAGEPSYDVKKLTRLALDGITGSSTRPLYAALAIGTFLMFASVAVGVFTIVEDFVLGDPLDLNVQGSAYVILAVLFAVSLVVLMQGITALYLARIYEESLDRPLYVVRSVTG